MKTTHSRKLARRIIGIAAGVTFIILWCALIFAMRPKIEERLQADTLQAIASQAGGSQLQVSLRGRNALIRGEFETEEERGRFQSFVRDLKVPGVREINDELTVRHIEMADPEFHLTVRSDKASVKGMIGDGKLHKSLNDAVKLATNGLPLEGAIELGENVHPAPWAEPLTAFLPRFAAGAAQPRIRVSNGSIRIAGEALDDAHKAAIDEAVAPLVASGLTLTNDLTIAKPVVIEPESPELEIRTFGKKVLVTGVLPIGSSREVILGAVQQGSEPGTVEDSLVVKENVAEPLWLPAFAKLSPVLLNSTTEPVLAATSTGLSVGGEARDDDARSEIESLLQQAASASKLPAESELTIPAPRDPVALALSNSGSELRLTGTLPDESFHQQLLTAVRRGSADLPLTNEAIIGDNVAIPNWGVPFGKLVTEVLIHAERSEIRIKDNRLTVDAFAENPDRAEAVELAMKYVENTALEVSPLKIEIAKAPEPKEEEPSPAPEIADADERTSTATDSGASLKPPAFLQDYIIYFGHGTALLKSKDTDLLREVAAKLKQHTDQKYVIAAFSDSSGNKEFNEYLRTERARNVKKTLIKFGVPAKSLETRGFGSLGPKDADKTDPRLKEFRRVEILVKADNAPVTNDNTTTPSSSPVPFTNADARSLARFFTKKQDGTPVMLASLTDSRVLAWAVAHTGQHTYSVALPDMDETSVPRAIPVMHPEALGTVYFEHGTAMLKEKGRRAVRDIAARLKSRDDKSPFFISGYADPVGDPEFNEWLSGERAKAVRDALRKEGIPAGRLRIRANGHANLVAPADTEEGLRLNRRVEINLGY